MITCIDCGTENIDGMLYCENCGAELSEASEYESSTDSDNIIPVGGATAKLIVASTGEEIVLPEKDEIVVGREDPVDAIFPDIDTTGYGGEEDGVSRKHAKISRLDDGYFVEDLNSVNATFVNKTKLEPQIPSPITDGDEVMFGRLKFNVALS